MKEVLFIKKLGFLIQVAAVVIPVIDALMNHNIYINPIIESYPYIGLVQIISCLANRVFLRRAWKSGWRMVYEFLLLAFIIRALTGIGGRMELTYQFNAFSIFCGLMALGYGAISIHEIWVIGKLIKEEEQRAIDRNEW